MKISIITPSFRQPEWLRLCLASVADQSLPSDCQTVGLSGDPPLTVEHIVQDACSGEKVRKICAEFPSVQLFQEKDGGMYDAVNRGLRRATGAVCAYLNCDEQYLPGVLAVVRDYFVNHPEVDVLFGDVVVVDKEGGYICSRQVLKPFRYHTQVCQLNTFTAATFFRRRIIEDFGLYFDTRWKNCGDAAWVAAMLEKGVQMAVLRSYTSTFTDTGNNMNLNDEGVREFQHRKSFASWWVQKLSTVWVIQHRLRRLIHGLYFLQPFSYGIFTHDSPRQRKFFKIIHPNYLWRDRFSLSR